MAEHSSFNAVKNVEVVSGMDISPTKTKVQEPADNQEINLISNKQPEHSSFNAVNNVEVVCGMAIPPIKTKVQGPAATILQQDVIDIIDEAIKFFRPNLLFKNYEIKGPGDIFIIYMTVFITQCLRKIANEEKEANALRMLVEMARLPVPKPNEAGFFMRGIAKDPTSNAEGEKFSAYLKQAKEELVNRLIKILYKDGVKSWDHKFWVGLSKKNFMNLKF